MYKETILKKMDELTETFRQLQQKKLELQQEIIKCEQEMLRLDGQYTAYATIIKELETTEPAVPTGEINFDDITEE